MPASSSIHGPQEFFGIRVSGSAKCSSKEGSVSPSHRGLLAERQAPQCDGDVLGGRRFPRCWGQPYVAGDIFELVVVPLLPSLLLLIAWLLPFRMANCKERVAVCCPGTANFIARKWEAFSGIG